MRIVALKSTKQFFAEHTDAERALLSWYQEASYAEWNHPNDLKNHYKSASTLNSKRVVFNINGNTYRLIVDIEYRLKLIFIVWFGAHRQYDTINAKTIRYVKTH